MPGRKHQVRPKKLFFFKRERQQESEEPAPHLDLCIIKAAACFQPGEEGAQGDLINVHKYLKSGR